MSEVLKLNAPDAQSEAPPSEKFARTHKRQLLNVRALIYAASIVLALAFFALDLLLPNTATPAIGYCLVLVLAAGLNRKGFLLYMAAGCTVMSWIDFFYELTWEAWGLSFFDSLMITMILWVVYFLSYRRIESRLALARQNQKLEIATQELKRSNAELDRFASVIAHDLRAPLNTISLFTHMMDDRRVATPLTGTHENLDSIQHEIRSMNTLIQSLLEYAHIGHGEVQMSLCACDELLASVLKNLKAALEQVGGTVTHDPLPALRGDPALLRQLFQNLIENSIKYRSDAPPQIHVTAVHNQEGWLFSIRDNGMGLPVADAQRIFEPFRQATPGNHRRGGVGLGLATCKKIVERHQGRIWVESTPGRGATFFFTLPRHDATGNGRHAATASPQKTSINP